MKNKIKYSFILVFLLGATFNLSFAAEGDKFENYKEKYKVNCANEKITDNHGNGFDDLYGTRNMRVILHGVAYRGGANNAFHKTNKRDNRNPLPHDGLVNLCKQGFSTAVYLYGKNFETADKKIISDDKKDTLLYIQNSVSNPKQMKEIFRIIQYIIQHPEHGPVYLHCWNGWHQSGYISAAILMQFCGISNEQAFQYWMDNTDGVNKGYDNVKNKVKNFKPFPDIKIDRETQEKICPCLKKGK